MPVTLAACAGVTFVGGVGVARADHGLDTHWNRNHPTPTSVAQVYFVDNTGPNWPVYTGVTKWDNRPNHYLPYYSNPGSCNDNLVHCVPVRSDNYGPSGWAGLTTYSVANASNLHVDHGSMVVKFNNYYNLNAHQRESTVCHELGHATGTMDEGSNTNSCMFVGPTPWPLNPSSHDYNIIENVYDH